MRSSHNSPEVLAIVNTEDSVPFRFVLTRLSDGKHLSAVAIASPHEHPVEDRPNSNLMRELRWYLENFLEFPFHPETIHAEHVLEALKAWGNEAFNSLFDRRGAGELLAKSSVIQIRSDDHRVLSWPWEALFDRAVGTCLAHRYRIERCLNQIADPPVLGELPNDRINILMIVARSYEHDVR